MDFTPPLIVIFFLILLELISRYASPSRTKPPPTLRLPPGPWPQLPLVGNLHHLLLSRFRDLPHRALRELSQAHGPLMLLRLGSVPTLVVSSAEAAMEVTKTHDLAFCSRHLSATIDILSCGGQGIMFSPYNGRWRELRKICALELFNQRRLLSFRPVREEEARRLVSSISGECAAAPAARSPSYRDEFLRELDEAVRLTGGFNLADLYPSSRLMRRFSAAARDMARCQSNIRRIIEGIIGERAAVSASSTSTAPEREEEDLLAVLLSLRLQKDGGLQFPLTNDILSTVVFHEVREVFKGQDHLTEDSMAKLSYMHLVIKETLRLHPPGPFLLPRECREACQVMGYDMPKGTAVFVNAWAISRDARYWDDAEEFKPERFESRGDIDFRGADFEFIPFGAGRRICPGMALGLTIMELVLASLLYHFDWELPGGIKAGELDMAETFGITVRRKLKLCAVAKPALHC
ncbi:hypothetical protein HU200_022679 [Digitaria exilis]|uniref:Cytochrome P450 n=1 Tax=Digitaria exilis TaxID=1010633 RepID=A0A835C659_9POAL|nr:hypothetical protein HU200_022679 [Digitaria exilis]